MVVHAVTDILIHKQTNLLKLLVIDKTGIKVTGCLSGFFSLSVPSLRSR